MDILINNLKNDDDNENNKNCLYCNNNDFVEDENYNVCK